MHTGGLLLCLSMGLNIAGWDSTRIRIANRDHWMCGICGRPIPQGPVRARHRNSLSIDHIKARVHGGQHHDANLRAVHYGCNASRGAHTRRDPRTQLRLLLPPSRPSRFG